MIKRSIKRKVEFNTTALPDIVFMLLFFFMVVTVMKESEDVKQIEVPHTENALLLDNDSEFIHVGIDISDNSTLYYINNIAYSNFDAFREKMSQLSSQKKTYDSKVKMKLHPDLQMKQVNEVKSLFQEYGFFNLEYIVRHGRGS